MSLANACLPNHLPNWEEGMTTAYRRRIWGGQECHSLFPVIATCPELCRHLSNDWRKAGTWLLGYRDVEREASLRLGLNMQVMQVFSSVETPQTRQVCLLPRTGWRIESSHWALALAMWTIRPWTLEIQRQGSQSDALQLGSTWLRGRLVVVTWAKRVRLEIRVSRT